MFLDNSKITPKEKIESSVIREVSNLKNSSPGNNLLLSKEIENLEYASFIKGKSSVEMNARFYKRKPGSIYGRMKYKYLGKNSEGNRFIKNGDL